MSVHFYGNLRLRYLRCNSYKIYLNFYFYKPELSPKVGESVTAGMESSLKANESAFSSIRSFTCGMITVKYTDP